MEITHKDALDSYAKALSPLSNTISIDKTLSETQTLKTMSLILNSASAVNEIMPIELLKLDELQLHKDIQGAGGKFSYNTGRIQIKSSANSRSNNMIGNALAHEYGHFLYENIIKDGDNKTLDKLYNLVGDMSKVFMDRDKEMLNKYSNTSYRGSGKDVQSILDYLVLPTELFARAFSGIALEDVEKEYPGGKSYKHNFTTEEMALFKDDLIDLCDNYKDLLISKEKDSNPSYEYNENHNPMLDNLDDTDKKIIYKTEDRLYLEDSVNYTDGDKRKNLNGELNMHKYVTRDINKNLSLKEQLDSKYNENDVFRASSYVDMKKKYSDIHPIKAYKREGSIDMQVSILKTTINELDSLIGGYNDNIDDMSYPEKLDTEKEIKKQETKKLFLNETLDSLRNEKMAINASDVKYSDDYSKYVNLLKSREDIDKIIDGLTTIDLNKKPSYFDKLKIVGHIKNKMAEKHEKSFLEVQSEIDSMEEDAAKETNWTYVESNALKKTNYLKAKDNWRNASVIFKHYRDANLTDSQEYKEVNDNLINAKSKHDTYINKYNNFNNLVVKDSFSYSRCVMKNYIADKGTYKEVISQDLDNKELSANDMIDKLLDRAKSDSKANVLSNSNLGVGASMQIDKLLEEAKNNSNNRLEDKELSENDDLEI